MFPEHIPEDIVDKLILLHSVFMKNKEHKTLKMML